MKLIQKGDERQYVKQSEVEAYVGDGWEVLPGGAPTDDAPFDPALGKHVKSKDIGDKIKKSAELNLMTRLEFQDHILKLVDEKIEAAKASI